MGRIPVIGIPDARHNMGLLTNVYGSTEHYLEAVRKAGGIPVQLPMMPGASREELRKLADLCDGFLFPGGGDFDPEWYGEKLLPELYPDQAAMDRPSQKTVLEFIRLAVETGKPILGVCLGMQILNIAMGGSLYQDIAIQLATAIRHPVRAVILPDRWAVAHSVSIAEGSLLHRIVGQGEIGVNSFHHQAVKEIASGFRVTATAPDGVAEAMEHDCKPILGVQWHPENMDHAGISHAEALFRWLVEAAK